MVASIMILSVYMPHGVAELEIVKFIMEEGWRREAKDFFIGGDFNTVGELRLAGRTVVLGV